MKFRFKQLKLNKKLRRAFVFFVVLSLGIGFAYIQSDLNINTFLTAIKGKWQLDYTNFKADTNSTATDDSYNYNNETNKITFTAPLNSLSDYYSFSFDIENNGTIEAKLNNYTINGLSESEQQYVDCIVTFVDGDTPISGDGIEVNTKETVIVTVKYKDSSNVSNGIYNLSLLFDYGKSDGYITRPKTLYRVLEQEATKGTLAKKYTGEHNDSMDASKSTENIYHWYADNNTDGTKVTNMNNVIFGGQCWQIIRTTDTGGVKLLYNGEPENGKCLDNRGAHVGYFSNTSTTLISDNYWYSDDYVYDKRNNEFYLEGNLVQSAWNETTREGLVGKYTCKSTSSDGRCSSLYMIMRGVSYLNSNYSNVAEIKTFSYYDSLGNMHFDRFFDSPAYAGYMFGEPYSIDYKKILLTDTSNQGIILIAKNRNGMNLLDTLIVSREELLANSSNYSDYKYTCNNTNSTCLENELRLITSIEENEIKYVSNRYWGSNITWDGTQYTLVDPIGVESYNDLDSLSSHHFTCISNGQKQCSSVAYINYFYIGDSFYYITLQDGTISIPDILNNMLTNNTIDSSIKTIIDAWYKKYLLAYDSNIDDVIYCGDRTVNDYGGWSINGSANASLSFKNDTVTGDLSCNNITDRFSISNNQAKLSYKAALATANELYLLNNNTIRKAIYKYWTMTSGHSFRNNSFVNMVDEYGTITDSTSVNNVATLRPTIALLAGIQAAYGDGSKEYPYRIITSNDIE